MKPSRKMCSNRFSTCARIRWWRPSWPPARSRFTAGFTISSPATFVAAGGIASSSRISMTIMRRRLLGLLRPDVFVWCLGGVWAGFGRGGDTFPPGKKNSLRSDIFFSCGKASQPHPFRPWPHTPRPRPLFRSGQYGPEVVLVGMFYYRLDNLAWLQFGFTVEVDHAVNFRSVGLGAADGAFFVNFINQHINGLANFGLQACR